MPRQPGIALLGFWVGMRARESGVRVSVEVHHVERLNMLVVAQAFKDGAAADSADAAVLERDHLMVEH